MALHVLELAKSSLYTSYSGVVHAVSVKPNKTKHAVSKTYTDSLSEIHLLISTKIKSRGSLPEDVLNNLK